MTRTPNVGVEPTEAADVVLLNFWGVGRFVGSRSDGATFEVRPAHLPVIAAALEAAITAARQRGIIP